MKRLFLHMMQMSKRIFYFVCKCMHALSFCCIRIYQILLLMHGLRPPLYRSTRGGKNNTNLHLHKDLDNLEESELDKMLEKALKNFNPIIDGNAEVVEESTE